LKNTLAPAVKVKDLRNKQRILFVENVLENVRNKQKIFVLFLKILKLRGKEEDFYKNPQGTDLYSR
jgi:hypothetical protein